MTSVSFPAADGTTLPAYLTLPPGSDGKNLQAIVMPHGGPASRDQWGFDWLTQFFVNRGYAVLQPNYRGSTGYGDDRSEEHTSELQSLMRISYAVFCLKQKTRVLCRTLL